MSSDENNSGDGRNKGTFRRAVPDPIYRMVEKAAISGWFRKIGPKIVPPLDRALHKLTGGRVMLAGPVLPTLMLTAIGRKSGKERKTPLACLPHEDGWIVVASNFGKEKHPAWSANLMANPQASISYKGVDHDVTAKLLDEDEKADLWPMLNDAWPNFDKYAEVSGRDLRVFHLLPR